MPEPRHEQEHEQSERCEPVRSRPVFVDVYAHKDANGDITFCHEWRLQERGPAKGKGAIEVPHGTPRSPIHFKLDDQTGLDVAFLEDAEAAFWASVGQCPSGVGNAGQIEFPDKKSHDKGKKLKVDNLNSAECDVHFALRFRDKHGNVLIYDPVIANKGGGP